MPQVDFFHRPKTGPLKLGEVEGIDLRSLKNWNDKIYALLLGARLLGKLLLKSGQLYTWEGCHQTSQ